MSRTFLKSWQDKRPGWSHRVRWYQDEHTIRLSFDGPLGVRHQILRSGDRQSLAQQAFDAFRTDHSTPPLQGEPNA